MNSNNKQIRPKLIGDYATDHFGGLNPLQKKMTKVLVTEAKQKEIVFTRAAVNYLLQEIEDPEIAKEFDSPTTKDVLLKLLAAASKHTKERPESETLLSFAAIKRALKGFTCPKPWC